MPTTVNKQEDPGYFAPLPTRTTRFFRTFIPYQIWRFIWLNIKMIKIIRDSH
jgi:hypothetical protein